MEKKKVNKSIVYMVSGIVVLILAIAGSAYAYYAATATGEIVGSAAGAGLELTIEKLSTSANDALIPLDNTVDMLSTAAKGYGNSTNSFDASKSCIDKNGYSVCQVYKITISNNSTVPVVLNGGVTLYGTNTPNIECAKMDSSTSITDNTSCIGDKTLANNYTLNAGSSNDYYVIVYIKNLDEEQEDIGDFNGTITFTSTQGSKIYAKFNDMAPIGTIADTITTLYSPNTTVTNNSITYNYDTTNNLMEDTAGNIRYYGASPNNYIDIGDTYKSDVTIRKWEDLGTAPFTTEEECKEYFNCSINYTNFGFSSEDECNSKLPAMVQQEFGMTIEEFNNTYCVVETIPKGTPILYRIIGVFGDKIKVIRNESIGEYSWDTSESTVNQGGGINEWSQADLMKLLNPGYENESIGGSLWYNSASGTCYSGGSNRTKSCDFTITGLSDNVKTKIAEVTWNLGGWSTTSIYPNQTYEYERGTTVKSNPSDGITRTTSWTGKIGLMYPSDYGYAADLTQCNQIIFDYNDETCKTNNWLYNGDDQWFLTPCSYNASYAFYVSFAGFVDNGVYVYRNFGVRPVLYLYSELVIESGSGTESNPYRISD